MSSSYANRVTRVPLDHLEDNPFQPRFGVNDESLEALVESIREYGFVGHVEVRRNPADPSLPLQIVFGHRRVEAAKRAGLATIPAAIVDRSDDQMRRLTFVENAARKDLSYWEEAVFVGEMRRELNLSVRQLAAALGKPKSWVQERLDILRLPEGPLREAAQRDEIAFSAAWLLVQMDAEERDNLFHAVKRGELNVSDLRALRRARLSQDRDQEADSDQLPEGAGGPRESWPGDSVVGVSTPRPASGRVIEVPLQRPYPPASATGTSRPTAAGDRPVAPTEMASRTTVLALAREIERTTRSLQARLRALDPSRLTSEEQSTLTRAKSRLLAVLAGID